VRVVSGEIGGEAVVAGSEPEARPTRSSVGELYERHIGPATALARLLTGDPHAAEDLAHDAFIRAAARFGALRDPAAFEAYLRRTVVNGCNARLRRLRLERAFLRRGFPAAAASPPAFEERDRLWTAILGLPYRQRVAVVLRFYEDLSEAQAAEVLRCSARAVNALISRAMRTLRGALHEEEEDGRA
jgi:RNA polymerase sigma factor (sigma-70 family)